jgi:probable FeS assembly SUF system protein SufT
MIDEPSKKIMLHLNRDTIARMVPQGAQILLREGTEVRLMQDKGNAYTVDVYGNLARIDGADADALGLTPKDPLEDLDKDTTLTDKINFMLEQVFDPEIPVSILALGLVYSIQINPCQDASHLFDVHIVMTLTAPGCGMGPVIIDDVKQKLSKIPEVNDVEVELVFDPAWDKTMMSDEAKLQLGIF